MIRQRRAHAELGRPPGGRRALAVLALAALALLKLPAPAGAVQIFIENAFVHRKNDRCVVETINGVPRFRCPPLPLALGCSVAVPSCDIAPGGGGFDCNGSPVNCGGACAGCGNLVPSINPNNGTSGSNPGFGNISNEPHIEFEERGSATVCDGASLSLPTGVVNNNVCNADLFLCGSVGYGNQDTSSTLDVAIDELSFEVFKFQDGTNPLDEASSPPLRTFFVDAPGVLRANCTSSSCGPLGPFCVLWDGSFNIQGEFGKTNGQYGFRVKTKTNQTGPSGNIQITAVRAYPSGATRDSVNTIVSQQPVTVDVTNIHVVRSSPSLVGNLTPVPVQPYNIFYRLSKDATMFIDIIGPETNTLIRSVLPGIVRIGEGVPTGTLTNGDSWNGRANNGGFMPPGNYLARLYARAIDQYGLDASTITYRQIGLDPLQITDIRVSPLLESATSLAVLDYVLTEPATVFIDVYPPGTQFCVFSSTNVNYVGDQADPLPPKNFQPTLGACPGGAAVPPLKRIVEQKNSRTRVINFWDGRDTFGQLVPDGDYVFVIYAAMPSPNGFPFLGSSGDKRIWTSQVKSGFIPVVRGFVAISQITPSSVVVGSSPSVAGLNPFQFRYSLSRDGVVNVRIFDQTGTRLIKSLVNNEIRQGLFPHVERWDEPTDDYGLIIESGTYMVQLTAADPTFPIKVTTTTALFSVNLFRITDVQPIPLLTGTSDLALLSYQLTQHMNIAWNVYPPGTVITNSSTTWPPCGALTPPPGCAQVLSGPPGAPGTVPVQPVVGFRGLRAGRLRITEQWDGRDNNGLLVPDGQYIFTLTAESTTTPRHFAIDRIIGSLAIQRGAIIFPTFRVDPEVAQLFNSSATVTLHPFTISYSVTRQSSVTIQVMTTQVTPQVVRNIISGAVRQGNILLQEVWDGRDDRGNFPPSGFYNVRAVASDIASQLATPSTAQLTITYDPLRIYDVAVSPIRLDTPGSSIFYQVSEPMKVAVKIFKPGTAFDSAGNPSPPESASLVKRIVGVKAARTLIEDIWDGTDLRLSLVPDGTYKFKIVGSTDARAIDDLTGNVLNPSALSLDRPIDDLPVVRNGSLDPIGDFERNTFAYPNPVTGPKATFSIHMPFQGTVKLRIYNIAGEMVLEKNFGEVAPSFAAAPLSFDWYKVNQAGRGVARGMYYAVVRAEETLGGRNILQTTKRLLIP